MSDGQDKSDLASVVAEANESWAAPIGLEPQLADVVQHLAGLDLSDRSRPERAANRSR